MPKDPNLESEAAWRFMEQFSTYVRRCDPQLWLRARQYAEDVTEVRGIPFTKIVDAHTSPDEPTMRGNLE